MCPPRTLTGSLFALLALLCMPDQAHAWTEAAVETVSANVEVAPDGTARVAMVLMVRIHAGWLTGLDVHGLDPDLTIDETKPPWAAVVTAAGRDVTGDAKLEPALTIRRGGILQFSFRGRGASPRQGLVEIGFVYHTNLANRLTRPADDGRVEIAWELPGWQTGLDGVAVTFSVPGPEGDIVASSDAHDQTIERKFALGSESSPRTLMQWDRAHLPRTVPWRVTAEVPGSYLDASLRGAPTLIDPKRAEGDETAPPFETVAILNGLLLFWLLCLGLAFRAALARGGWVELPLRSWLVATLQCGFFAGTLFTAETSPWVSAGFTLGMLGVGFLPHAIGRSSQGAASPSRQATSTLARWILGSHPLDPSGLLGLLFALGLAFAFVVITTGSVDDPTLLSLSVLGVFMSALHHTRFSFPANVETRNRVLLECSRKVRLRGAWFERRRSGEELCFRIGHPAFVRDNTVLTLTVGSERCLGGFRPNAHLHITTAPSSACAQFLAGKKQVGLHAIEGRTPAILVPFSGEILRGLHAAAELGLPDLDLGILEAAAVRDTEEAQSLEPGKSAEAAPASPDVERAA